MIASISDAPVVAPLGEYSWLVRFSGEREARSWATAARAASWRGVTDVVLAYTSVAVYSDPEVADVPALEASIRGLSIPRYDAARTGRLIVVPTLYDGLDLAEVACLLDLSVQAVIEAHAEVEYDVFAIGFQPGFPYAGYLREPLASLPRRATPRVRVPAGSVAIAARQTGIYPVELPGGWNLLGRTPLSIVDVAAGRFPIRAGDRLRFEPISRDEFDARQGEALA
jgi:KipI family sensor histidine kinase inhibitor